MKNEKNVKKIKKQPTIKTKHRLDGGREVEMTKSPSKTLLGKIFAITIAALTILLPLIGLIYIIIELSS